MLPSRLRSRGAIAIGVLLMVMAALWVEPGRRAAGVEGGAALEPIAVLVPDDSLDPRILGLELGGAAWRNAAASLDDALFARAENARELDATSTLFDALAHERDELTGSRTALRRELGAARRELADVERILQARALQRYVHFGDEPLVALDDPAAATDEERSQALAERVDEVQFGTRQDLLELIAERERRLDAAAARLVEVDVEIASTLARHGELIDRQQDLDAAVERAATRVRNARRSARVPGYDLSVVALDAYLRAEALLGSNWSSCSLRWWMIAGVARIESRHGQIGGRSLQAGGRPSRSIVGIALDGGPNVLAIPDTDGGRLDGDDTWDRAVGPLQFIPETWARRGRDGSGDGVADPQNIYDAAYSAGRYLCAIGGNLATTANLRAAYFGYNNSSAYVDAVSRWADRYAGLELPAVVDAVENEG